MKYKLYINLTFIIILFNFLFTISCQQSLTLKQAIDCQCITQEPFDWFLTIEFTRDTAQRSPQILILSGYYEEHNIIDTLQTDTVPAYRNFIYYRVPVNHYYSAVCLYVRDGDTIRAIDGNFLKKESYYDSDCDTICWKLTGSTLNVKLKNTRR